MVYTDTIKVNIKSQGIFDLTGNVEDAVRRSKVKNGICTIFSVGSTSALIINEDEPMLLEDIRNSLKKISNESEIYHHAENAHSHIRSTILGNSQSIPIKDGKLVLGTWQNVIVFNFSNKDREREVIITVVGD